MLQSKLNKNSSISVSSEWIIMRLSEQVLFIRGGQNECYKSDATIEAEQKLSLSVGSQNIRNITPCG